MFVRVCCSSIVRVCLCASVGLSGLMPVDTCGSPISWRSRDSQRKPSHAGIHGNHKNYISSFPGKGGDSKMLKCTNTLSLPSSLILNRVRLFLPAALIVRCVAYTCNLEIPLVTFPTQKLHIIFTCSYFLCPHQAALLNICLHPQPLSCLCFTFLHVFVPNLFSERLNIRFRQ